MILLRRFETEGIPAGFIPKRGPREMLAENQVKLAEREMRLQRGFQVARCATRLRRPATTTGERAQEKKRAREKPRR